MHTQHRRTYRWLSVGLFTVLIGAACGDGGTEPRTPDLVQPILTQMSFGDWNNYTTSGLTGRDLIVIFAFPAWDASRCNYTVSDGSFTCPTFIRLVSTSYAYKYFLLDGAGAPMSSYTAGTTRGVRLVADVSGIQGFDQVHRHGELTLIGLPGSVRTLTGTRVDHDTVFFNQTPSSHTEATTTANLTFQPGTGIYPTSGTLTTDAVQTTTSEFIGSSVVATHVVVTFANNAKATVTFDVTGQPTSTCVMNLAVLSPTIAASCV